MVRNLPTSHRSTAALAVLMLLLVAACGQADRPSVAEWQPSWDRLLSALPTEDTLGDPPDTALCEHAVGLLRSSQSDLLPTPDVAIDDVVGKWVRIAEDAMFECPPSSDEIPDMASAYAELARLQAEVEVVLVMDSGG